MKEETLREADAAKVFACLSGTDIIESKLQDIEVSCELEGNTVFKIYRFGFALSVIALKIHFEVIVLKLVAVGRVKLIEFRKDMRQ